MADTVDTQVLEDTRYNRKIRITNLSDGTGESAVIKIDKSTLTDLKGLEPYRLDVVSLKWSIQGFAYVALYWDHTTDDEIAVLSGSGERDYFGDGNLRDPRSAGGTGDILVTAPAGATTGSYDITIEVRLVPQP